MKRYGNLMPSILAYDNLMSAFCKAAKGKTHRAAVINFRKNLFQNLGALGSALESGTLQFGRYTFFTVHDPKTRQICAASFVERVAHHAIMNVCGPLLDKSQIFHSYACRTGKGQHRALAMAAKWAERHSYYLKMDVRLFFASIDHGRLKALLAGRIKDEQVLDLLGAIIDSFQDIPGKGLPLGNLTSQYFANFYLNRFDLWVTQECRAAFYLRYMDDILIFADKLCLLNLSKEIRKYLKDHLALEVKYGGQINRTQKGIGFLGAVVYPGYIRLNNKAKKRVRNRMKSIERRYRLSKLDESELQARATALWAGLRHARANGWQKNLALRCMDT